MEENRGEETAVPHRAPVGRAVRLRRLWEHWGHNGSAIDSCTIITGEPNELAAQVHDRMPVILKPEDYDRWLDPKSKDAEELQALLVPYPAEEMAIPPVSTRVNSPRNEGTECIEGITEGT